MFEKYQKEMQQYIADTNGKSKTNNGLDPAKPKQPPQYILVDSTPEALTQAMAVNPRGITLLREELKGWFDDFGRYNKSGEQSNLLSTWSQSPFKVNRKNGENEFIREPFSNVFGDIQVKLLQEMAKDNRADNGFLPRFCFVFPDKIEASMYIEEELPESLQAKYGEYINHLLSIPGYRNEVRLCDDASKLYETFYNKNALMNNSGDLPDYLMEVNSKLNIIVLRSAVLFHYSQWACTGNIEPVISEATMSAAIKLAEYFRITAKKVYEIISNQSITKFNIKEIAKFLITLGNSQTEIAKVLKVSHQYINKLLKQ